MRTESWCGHEIRFVEVDGEWWAIFEDIRKTVGVGSYIISDLFPLRNPINCAILIYGGILTNICIWSGHASASIISTPFCSQSFLMISLKSFSTDHIFLFA